MTHRPLLAVLALLSCAPKPAAEPTVAAAPAEPTLAQTVLGDMDRGTDPCVDFYQYACGGWLERTELPADKPSWSRSFSQIHEANRVFVHDMLEKAAKDPASGDEDWARLGHYYGSCMDEAGIEAAGTAPLAPVLDPIAALSDKAGLMKLVAELDKDGVSTLFSAEVEGDFKDPQLIILHLAQGGLALPDRDYYLAEDEDGKALIADYRAYVAGIFVLLGDDPAAARASADAVVDFETDLARTHVPLEELRDPEKTYNKVDLVGVKQLAPGLDWDGWLGAWGAAGVTDINVLVPDTLTKLDQLVGQTELGTLKAYLRFHAVSSYAPHLPKAFVDANFAFFRTRVLGQQQNEDRWKRCVDSSNSALGEVIGRYYVEARFAGDSKTVGEQMIHGIEDAFEAGLGDLAWMDEQTRARAIDKKNTLRNKIGYPSKWRDYSALQVGEGTHVANVIAARRNESAYWIGKVGMPADPEQWYMTPQIVNAYYHPLYNEMVFPAGILQPPFFRADYPSAINYGGIGMVEGHELTHGFDDSGRKFDPQGRMTDWWAPEASERFEEATTCVEQQYDAYEVVPGVNINGKLTLGENIADLGGVRLAHRAWQAQQPADAAPAIEGLSDDQLFFVAFAQGWCHKSSPEYEKMLATSDGHSSARYRVIGSLSNLPEFHEAFSCEQGKPMHPVETCEVW